MGVIVVELRAAITTQVGRPLRTKPFLISVGMHGNAVVVVDYVVFRGILMIFMMLHKVVYP